MNFEFRKNENSQNQRIRTMHTPSRYDEYQKSSKLCAKQKENFQKLSDLMAAQKQKPYLRTEPNQSAKSIKSISKRDLEKLNILPQKLKQHSNHFTIDRITIKTGQIFSAQNSKYSSPFKQSEQIDSSNKKESGRYNQNKKMLPNCNLEKKYQTLDINKFDLTHLQINTSEIYPDSGTVDSPKKESIKIQKQSHYKFLSSSIKLPNHKIAEQVKQLSSKVNELRKELEIQKEQKQLLEENINSSKKTTKNQNKYIDQLIEKKLELQLQLNKQKQGTQIVF